MEKDKTIDYFQAIRDFDKSHDRKPDNFSAPLKSSEEPDGGVNYLVVSRKWKEYLDSDQSVIHNEKKQ